MATSSAANDFYRSFGGTSANFLTKQAIGMAKPSVYPPNGTGRDTYIDGNNGGLYRPYRPASAVTCGSFRTVRAPDYNLANLGSKRSNYHCNGTGRDGYIGQSNGGFYPPKQTAEFSRHFVSSLRYYETPCTPADIVRPKTTKGARSMAKVMSSSVNSSQGNPYMRSQTYFMKNAAIKEKTRQMHRYQEDRSRLLSTPKKENEKFTKHTMTQNATTKRRITFTDKCIAIQLSDHKKSTLLA